MSSLLCRPVPILVSLLLAAACSGAAVCHAEEASEGPPAATPEEPKDRKMAVVPSIAYNPDDGLGLGIYGDVVGLPYPEEQRRHRTAFGFNAKIWLKPRQVGWNTNFGLSWFPAPSGDTELWFGLTSFGRTWDWWFGEGMDSVRDRSVDTGDDRVPDYHHRFKNYRVRTETRLFQRLVGPLDAFGGIQVTYSWVGAHDDTLLAEQIADGQIRAPDGGANLGFDAGLRVDGRNDRVDPTLGGLVMGIAQFNIGPAGPWGRLTLDVRGFLGPPRGEVVLAGQILAQVGVGDTPFYEQSVISGFEIFERTITGLAGLRGLDRGRLRAPLGIVGHVETRFRPPVVRIFKWLRIRAAPVVWADVARVDQPGRVGVGWPLQPGLGGGVRLTFNEVTVTRLDLATAPEPMVTADGEETRWTFGVYAITGHMF